MIKYKPPYACPKCDGVGVYECLDCGIMVECRACDGRGLDVSVVDVAAFFSAAEDLRQQQESCHRYSVAWIEDGVQVGVRFHDGNRLAVKDFLREEKR